MVGRFVSLGLAVTLASGAAVAAASACDDCLVSRFWLVDSSYWRGTGPPDFPERQALEQERPHDVGIAFSGGGTRAAAAAIGQLRGLKKNGWLDRVRYMTAVSGGSWTAVPFTYSRTAEEDLLGPYEEPSAMTIAAIEADPKSRLLKSVADSKLSAAGFHESLQLVARARADGRQVRGIDIAPLVDRLFGQRFGRDQTFADMLGRLFIRPHVERSAQLYGWNGSSVLDIVGLNRRFAPSDLLTPPADKPFLIVGGTLIYQHQAFAYPALLPVEYTPLYTGIRQQFGSRLGGAYVWPLAYDTESAEVTQAGTVRVASRTAGRAFTLADMIASSGAAPLLGLFRGKPLAAATIGVQFFPTFNHFAIRDGRAAPTLTGISHGDGGFTDNLGLMPLLARQVRNVIVFVNAKDSFETSLQLQSLFFPIDQQDDWSGDRSVNVVFETSKWEELRDGFAQAVAGKRAVVHCGRNWTVKPNELYNIRGYSGLNICFVYNHTVESWMKALPQETQNLLPDPATGRKGTRRLRRFPWFATFGENRPRVIRLNEPQVNLLANLASWTVTNQDSVDRILEAFGGALPRPAR